MSTANNRLEIVGLGKKSVTFRFIQTDRTYDPVAQTGAKGIVGRASTRSEETDFSRLEHFVVEMNDPESNGTTITRIIRPKENKRRDGQENSSVLKGEFAPADHNVWTDLSSSASPSEANALNADYASPAVINNYPNIIATKYGTYNPGDSTTAAANSSGNGSELFGNGKAHGDSGLVRFLSGLNMTAGFHGEANVTPYVLKDEGSGAGTIMFRIVAGEERHDDDEGVIEPNKHYHIVSVEAHFLNKKEVFSNDEKLSKQLLDVGEKVDEKLWRMPLHKNFDKLINSKNADMQNINYIGGAGSTTAAQFLQRFILNNTPWAHLDIAGMAFSKYGGALNSGGATGYGVRLLNQLIEEHYE